MKEPALYCQLDSQFHMFLFLSRHWFSSIDTDISADFVSRRIHTIDMHGLTMNKPVGENLSIKCQYIDVERFKMMLRLQKQMVMKN